MSKLGPTARAVVLYKNIHTPIALVCKFNHNDKLNINGDLNINSELNINDVKFACDKENDCEYKICPFDGCANKNINLDDYIRAKKESGTYFKHS
jgi:hypothetical protein